MYYSCTRCNLSKGNNSAKDYIKHMVDIWNISEEHMKKLCDSVDIPLYHSQTIL
jgi:hypothetical protein